MPANIEINNLSEYEKLRLASDLIKSVTDVMDMGGKECKCCGAMRRFRFNEYKVAVALGPMPSKLSHYADMIGGERE